MIVNTEALDLGLGSGGFDLVHVNLTRGLDAGGSAESHVMKLNYSLAPAPGRPGRAPLRGGRRTAVSASRCW